MVAEPDLEPLPTLTKICARGAKPIGVFGLVTPLITIAYQLSDLGLSRPGIAFTNLYHREEGQGIDRSVVGVVVAGMAVGYGVVATWAVW